ncbi:DUF1456 family protein, partial [Pseudomonas aeruginosa]|uniref:DUF1456 family protein n=1 Tax=Pseudomonas aeruginosa TaxID=287 RepID=UPI0021F10AB6
MLNNDVLRSLRYLLDLPDAHLAELAAPFGEQVEADLLEAYLKKEDEDGFQACPDRYLARCLDGLIIQRRGGGGGGAPPPPPPAAERILPHGQGSWDTRTVLSSIRRD